MPDAEAKVQLEQLLQHPALWRGRSVAPLATFATGFALLDQALPGGGWPRTGLIEVLTAQQGLGELQLWMPALAGLSSGASARWCALIDPPFEPFAPAFAAAGVQLEKLLIVRPPQVLWTVEQALLSGACDIVLAWIARVAQRDLRRLALATEQGRAPAVIFRPCRGGAGVLAGCACALPCRPRRRVCICASSRAAARAVASSTWRWPGDSRVGRTASLACADCGRADGSRLLRRRAAVAPALPRMRRELWAAVQWPVRRRMLPPHRCSRSWPGRRSVSRRGSASSLLMDCCWSCAAACGSSAASQSLFGQLQGQFAPASYGCDGPYAAGGAGAGACRQALLSSPIPRGLVSRLAPLPLRCLRWPEQAIARLASMGVRTIGEVLRLPRAGFAQRFGTALLDAGQARGPPCRSALGLPPPERFAMRCEPTFELAEQECGAAARSAPALASLESFLRERQRGVMALAAAAGASRLACQPLRAAARPRRSTARRSSRHCWGRSCSSWCCLHRYAAASCVPARCLSTPLASDALWRPGEHGGGAGAQMPAFLERLRARLGAEAVQGLCLVPGPPSRMPRGRTSRCCAARRAASPCRPAPAVLGAGCRPLWLLREPANWAAAPTAAAIRCSAGERSNPCGSGAPRERLVGRQRHTARLLHREPMRAGAAVDFPRA